MALRSGERQTRTYAGHILCVLRCRSIPVVRPHLTKRWSERPPVVRSHCPSQVSVHCERCAVSVAVAHLILVRCQSRSNLTDVSVRHSSASLHWRSFQLFHHFCITARLAHSLIPRVSVAACCLDHFCCCAFSRTPQRCSWLCSSSRPFGHSFITRLLGSLLAALCCWWSSLTSCISAMLFL